MQSFIFRFIVGAPVLASSLLALLRVLQTVKRGEIIWRLDERGTRQTSTECFLVPACFERYAAFGHGLDWRHRAVGWDTDGTFPSQRVRGAK